MIVGLSIAVKRCVRPNQRFKPTLLRSST
jgi:hypothetical protein